MTKSGNAGAPTPGPDGAQLKSARPRRDARSRHLSSLSLRCSHRLWRRSVEVWVLSGTPAQLALYAFQRCALADFSLLGIQRREKAPEQNQLARRLSGLAGRSAEIRRGRADAIRGFRNGAYGLIQVDAQGSIVHEWRMPADPEVFPNGNIIVYDNRTGKSQHNHLSYLPHGQAFGWSRIAEINPCA